MIVTVLGLVVCVSTL